MFPYLDEDIPKDYKDSYEHGFYQGLKFKAKYSAQRFFYLCGKYNFDDIRQTDEYYVSSKEIKEEGKNLIEYVKKIVGLSNPKRGKNNAIVNASEEVDEDVDEVSDFDDISINENGVDFEQAMNDEGLNYSDLDSEVSQNDEKINIPESLYASSGDSEPEEGDNILKVVDNNGTLDLSNVGNNRTNKRKHKSSESSIESYVPSRKNYKLIDTDEESIDENDGSNVDNVDNIDNVLEDNLSVNYNNDGEALEEEIDLICLSSDTDEEQEAESVPIKKYGRKILSDRELIQSTKEAKKINNIYGKEYAARIKNNNIIKYSNDDKNKPYYERRIDSVTLEYCKQDSVTVDKVFLRIMKPHQAEGIDFLYFSIIRGLEHLNEPGLGAILAHCMGLGKTFQTIVFLQTIFFHSIISKKISKALLLVPTNVINNWQMECEKWQSLLHNEKKRFVVHVLVNERAVKTNYLNIIKTWANSERPGLLICGYEMFRNLAYFSEKKKNRMRGNEHEILGGLYYKYLMEFPHLVICDEAHRLKNVNSQLAKVVNSIKTRRRICLTGTPIQNNLKEYYTMVDFVRPNILGTQKEFSNQFVNPIEKGVKRTASKEDIKTMKKRYAVLWRLLGHVLHRKDATFLYSTLLPKEEYIIYVAATKLQRELLRDLIDSCTTGNKLLSMKPIMSYICTHPSILNSPNIQNKSAMNIAKRSEDWLIEKSSILSQIDSHNFELSSKIMILFDIIRYAEREDDKVLVFVQYRETINYIEEALKYLSQNNLWYNNDHKPVTKTSERSWVLYRDYFIITGETPLPERTFIETRINMRPTKSKRARLVLMTTKAASLGTNFIGANRVVLFESGFNPSDDVQALHRVYRIGQKKATYVYRLVVQGTIEERIQERQVIKEGISRRAIDKQNIRGIYDDEDVCWNKLDCIDVDDPKFVQEQLIKPNDDLLTKLILNNKRKILKYVPYDSLLENKVDEGLTEEEKEEEWKNYTEQLKRLEDMNTTTMNTNLPMNRPPAFNNENLPLNGYFPSRSLNITGISNNINQL
uniref:Transcriptional regulator ATRX n=1 Tax=Parastrongyloides trichosuri TaxID=131310 RepID=A0A0N4ZRS9_PARTI